MINHFIDKFELKITKTFGEIYFGICSNKSVNFESKN